MAFLKKKSKVPVVLLKGFLLLLILAFLLGGLYVLHVKQLKEVKVGYEDKVQQYQYELYTLERQAFVPKKDIPYGTVVSESLFNRVNMKFDVPQEMMMDETDLGKVNMIVLPAGIPVTKSAMVSTVPASDLRKLEFNMFILQTDQKLGDTIDVRILFPNAENYIVLGKKQIKQINRTENLLWLWLDETEIHRISSAIVDAYLHPGTKIYISTYIQPEMQEASMPFYPPNPDVLDLMQKDPNIVNKASDVLAREARAILEQRLEMMTYEELSRVSSGVDSEIAKTNEQIKNEERNQVILEEKESPTETDEVTSVPDTETEASDGMNGEGAKGFSIDTYH